MANFRSQLTKLNIVKFRSGLIRSNTAKFGLVPTRPNFGHDQLD